MEMSSLRMLEVMAIIGVLLSNCLIRWQADTPSRFGMMMSMRIMSYLDPAFSLFTASNPSSYSLVSRSVSKLRVNVTYGAVNRTIESVKELAPDPPTCGVVFDQ